jgi:hypothetical protein
VSGGYRHPFPIMGVPSRFIPGLGETQSLEWEYDSILSNNGKTPIAIAYITQYLRTIASYILIILIEFSYETVMKS